SIQCLNASGALEGVLGDEPECRLFPTGHPGSLAGSAFTFWAAGRVSGTVSRRVGESASQAVFAMRSVVARASRVVALPPGDIGVLLRVFEDVLAEVDVDLWPMVVPRGRFLCVEDGLDGLVLEPGVLGVGHE